MISLRRSYANLYKTFGELTDLIEEADEKICDKELREIIDNDIEKVGGIEEFNNYSCANECIINWIDRILDIIENKEE